MIHVIPMNINNHSPLPLLGDHGFHPWGRRDLTGHLSNIHLSKGNFFDTSQDPNIVMYNQ